MKRCTTAYILILSVLLVFTWFAPAWAAGKTVTFNTAWEPEFETFITWYAKEKGWDKEAGLEFNIKYFDSGMGMMEALPAKQWVVGACSGTPATVGAARYGTKIIAIASDEGLANAVFVRPDSPILKVKGWNPKFPEVYGSPETVKGKTVVCTTVTSGHFVLSAWLGIFGLKDTDIVIKNMDPFQCVAAFESGIGDMVSLWAPHMYTGIEKGWKIAGNIRNCGASMPLVIIGETEYLEKNPEVIAKFLKVYFRGIDMMKNTPVEKLVPEYQKFMLDFCGLEMSESMCKMDIENHPVFDLREQLKVFDASKGASTVEGWQKGILEFFTAQKKLKEEDANKVVGPDGRLNFITDKYLKMLAK
ncbi:MAG: ABC transporter substrate-binding protein [Desulfobacteraceae bacterium]|nr:ABC transporter substrate-binding protein [Desulfobacteraceae bacterium]